MKKKIVADFMASTPPHPPPLKQYEEEEDPHGEMGRFHAAIILLIVQALKSTILPPLKEGDLVEVLAGNKCCLGSER